MLPSTGALALALVCVSTAACSGRASEGHPVASKADLAFIVVEAAEVDVDAGTSAATSVGEAEPANDLPSFCLEPNEDIRDFIGVPLNGPGCAHDGTDAVARAPSATRRVPRARLCDVLRHMEDGLAEEGEPVPCALMETLGDGYALYTVGSPSYAEAVYLVRGRGTLVEIVALLGTFSSGTGNVSAYIRGGLVLGADTGFTFVWRFATTDWDVGWGQFNAMEQCMAIQCEREGAGHVCSGPRILRSYGGLYGVGPRDERSNWYTVGAPIQQWDCRPR